MNSTFHFEILRNINKNNVIIAEDKSELINVLKSDNEDNLNN